MGKLGAVKKRERATAACTLRGARLSMCPRQGFPCDGCLPGLPSHPSPEIFLYEPNTVTHGFLLGAEDPSLVAAALMALARSSSNGRGCTVVWIQPVSSFQVFSLWHIVQARRTVVCSLGGSGEEVPSRHVRDAASAHTDQAAALCCPRLVLD